MAEVRDSAWLHSVLPSAPESAYTRPAEEWPVAVTKGAATARSCTPSPLTSPSSTAAQPNRFELTPTDLSNSTTAEGSAYWAWVVVAVAETRRTSADERAVRMRR